LYVARKKIASNRQGIHHQKRKGKKRKKVLSLEGRTARINPEGSLVPCRRQNVIQTGGGRRGECSQAEGKAAPRVEKRDPPGGRRKGKKEKGGKGGAIFSICQSAWWGGEKRPLIFHKKKKNRSRGPLGKRGNHSRGGGKLSHQNSKVRKLRLPAQ